MTPRSLLAPLLLSACLDLELSADLVGPRVIASSLPGPRTVEVPVRAALDVVFSEAIDPASVRVAMIPWPEVGSCALTPICKAEHSTCERGRCQTDPLTPADLKRAAKGQLPTGSPIEHVLSDSDDTTLKIVPARALTAAARHSLLVFARDRSGAAVVDADGLPGVWRRDLVTAGEGSSGPEARLVSPPPGAVGVPPNVAHVDTAFARPVTLDPTATLRLTSAADTLMLTDPAPCPGWVPGLCLRWRPARPLRASTTYAPADGSLQDLLGRPAVVATSPASFTTAATTDTTPPQLTATFVVRGPCLYAALIADEPLLIELELDAAHTQAITGGGPVQLALRLDPDLGPGDPLAGTLAATDLADNRRELPVVAVVDPSFPRRPPLGLAEILANPLGAEPRQEFVELADPRSDGEPALWDDLYLADEPWPAVLAALAAGDDPPGDRLPPLMIAPGARVLVVAAGFDPAAGEDPPPAPGTALLRVDASLGAGGLKNAGEPLTLYAWSHGPPALIAAYANTIPTGAAAHAGRSVVADPAACDVPQAWASHPFGTSSPGVRP